LFRRRPDHAQIEALYREHGAGLLLFATAIAGGRSHAQDAVHQVFLRLLERIDMGRVLNPKAYLYASVRNAALNNAKAHRREITLEDECAWFQTPNRDYVGELNVRRSLLALPSDQREVVVLHLWCELTFAEVAEVLEISSNTAASRYRYALTKLRDAINGKEGSHAATRRDG
jgi:RNA polymerase sigma-70 factor (ECF subfamily)